MTDRQKEALRKCGIPEAEWADIEATDKQIDRGEKLFDLDPELEAGAKKARQADRKQTTVKREKKPKPEKEEICSAMMEGLREVGVEEFEVINPEREFIFHKDGTKYKVTLACPRK